jgi:hypothetical protein
VQNFAPNIEKVPLSIQSSQVKLFLDEIAIYCKIHKASFTNILFVVSRKNVYCHKRKKIPNM